MKSIVINVKNDTIFEKIKWLIEHFKHDGVEIVSKEDLEDLKLLKKTRNDECISFEDYLKNEN